jgi:hypothetical protein
MRTTSYSDIQLFRNQRWIEDCLIKLLCVLALDRFGDYVSSNIVAPVRENVAQVISVYSFTIIKDALSCFMNSLNYNGN